MDPDPVPLDSDTVETCSQVLTACMNRLQSTELVLEPSNIIIPTHAEENITKEQIHEPILQRV